MKRFTLLSLVVLAAMLLGACAVPTPVEKIVPQTVVVEKVVDRPVVQTVVVEKEKIVEKIVPQTVVVEKVVEKAPVQKLSGAITVWVHPAWSDGAAEQKWFNDAVTKFQTENPGTKVNLVIMPWDGAYQKKAVAIQTGQTPDVSYAGAEQNIAFAAMGAMLPLDDLVKELGGPEVFLDKMNWRFWNGHYWGVPWMEGGYILYIRKDITEKAGFKGCPKTWEDLTAMAEKINDPKNNVYAIGLDYSAGNNNRQRFEALGATCDCRELDADGKVAVAYPGNAKLLKFYTDFALKGQVPPGATAITQYQVTSTPLDEWFEAGQIAMTIGMHNNAQLWPKSKPDLWAKTQICALPDGGAGHTGTFAQPGSWYIFNNTKNPDLAKAWLRFILRPDISKDYAENSLYPVYSNITYSYSNSEWFKIVLEELKYGVRAGYPTITPKNGDAEESFWPALMVQDVVVNKMPVQDALNKWQKEVEKIYGVGCSPSVPGCK